MKHDPYPTRIVCLTEETTETLYLLGEQHRIAGISVYTVRPPEAGKEKPKVSAFTSANIDEINNLNPDLIVGFSDIQAETAKRLIAEGHTVWINNHRSISEIKDMIVRLGAMVGKTGKALELVEQYNRKLEGIRQLTDSLKTKPRVYFEEWYDPMISGIRWVSEIIRIAGGTDIFPEHASEPMASGRIINNPEEVVRRNPEIILASWCGKKFRKPKLTGRPGWDRITAVKNNDIYEVDSSIILQPGPAALTDGLDAVHKIIRNWVERNSITNP